MAGAGRIGWKGDGTGGEAVAVGEVQRGYWTGAPAVRQPAAGVPGSRGAPEDLPAVERRPGLTSVIIIAHGRLALTRECVESVLAWTRPPHELILVDNGSGDATGRYFAELAARHPHVRAIVKERHYGVYARTFGMQAARGEFICWLDNDVVVGRGWLEPLLQAMADPSVGGVGPEGVALSPQWQHLFHTQTMAPEAAAGRAVDIVVGYCFLFRNLTHFIGYLDPQFHPFWNEEADYSLRIKLLGYKLVVVPTNVVHRRHGTGLHMLADREAQIARMNRALIEKWEPFKERVLECYRCGSG